jgi:hypothetical protein
VMAARRRADGHVERSAGATPVGNPVQLTQQRAADRVCQGFQGCLQ